jgi:2-amino-4-hydroxy-6-hydroxymethyldihydropteridine diphosphokinase
MNNIVFLGLGSNRGDRLKYLQQAVILIKENKNCYISKISQIYETIPYGNKKQSNFYNAVIEVKTSLFLKEFFHLVKKIETKVGRSISERWGPREIDIDILFFNDLVYEDKDITVPHPGILERDFVLIPLLSIGENIIHPKTLRLMSDLEINKLDNHILNIIPGKLL